MTVGELDLKFNVKGADEAADASDDVSSSLEDTEDAASGASSGLESISQSAQQVGETMQSVGATLTKFVTLPLAGIGAASAKAAGDFEESFSRIEGLVGVAEEQVGQFEDQVLELSDEVAQSPRELADALFYVTSAGLEGETAMNALEASAKAAAAGLGDTRTVADAATSAMNAYGQETLSATGATDILVATIREGKAQPEELANSLGKVIPTAAAVGVEFEQVGAAIAAMTRQGANARRATTALNSLLTQLQRPSKEAEETLQQVGLTMSDLRQRVEEDGLLAVMNLLQREFQGNTEALASLFGNIRAMRAALQLTGESTGETRKIFEELKDTTNATDEAFAEAKETFNFQFKQFRAAVERLRIQIGNELLPALTNLLGKVQKLTSAFGELDKEVRQNIIIGGTVAASLGLAASAAGFLISGLGKLAGAVKTAGAALSGLGLGTAAAQASALVAALASGAGLAAIMDTTSAAGELSTETQRLTEDFTGLISELENIEEGDLASKLEEVRGLHDEIGRAVINVTSKLEDREARLEQLKRLREETPEAVSQASIERLEAQVQRLREEKSVLTGLQGELGRLQAEWQNVGDDTEETADKTEQSAQRMKAAIENIDPATVQAAEEVETPSVGSQIPDQIGGPNVRLGELQNLTGAADSVREINALIRTTRANFDTLNNTEARDFIGRLQAARESLRGATDLMGQLDRQTQFILKKGLLKIGDQFGRAFTEGLSGLLEGQSRLEELQQGLDELQLQQRQQQLRDQLSEATSGMEMKVIQQRLKIVSEQLKQARKEVSLFGKAFKGLKSIFKTVVRSVVQQLTALIAKLAIVALLKNVLGGPFGLFSGGAGAAGNFLGGGTGGAIRAIPAAASGGFVEETGIAKIHKGEQILPVGSVQDIADGLVASVAAASTPSVAAAGGAQTMTHKVKLEGQTTLEGRTIKTVYDTESRAQRRKGHSSRS